MKINYYFYLCLMNNIFEQFEIILITILNFFDIGPWIPTLSISLQLSLLLIMTYLTSDPREFTAELSITDTSLKIKYIVNNFKNFKPGYFEIEQKINFNDKKILNLILPVNSNVMLDFSCEGALHSNFFVEQLNIDLNNNELNLYFFQKTGIYLGTFSNNILPCKHGYIYVHVVSMAEWENFFFSNSNIS